MAVCWLYMGRLKEALSTLENLIHTDPARFLQEGLLFNLCTLYELESSRAIHKKQALLDLVSKHKGNGFNTACLKIQWYECQEYLCVSWIPVNDWMDRTNEQNM